MAYRRKQQQQQQGTVYPTNPRSNFAEEEVVSNASPMPQTSSIPASDLGDDWYFSSSSSSSSSSLAAKAIRASSAYRDSSLSSAYSGHRAATPLTTTTTSTSSASRYTGLTPNPNPTVSSSQSFPKDTKSFEYQSMKNLNEPKQGFWGALARKAKSIMDDDDNDNNNYKDPQQLDTPPGGGGDGRTIAKAQIPVAGTRGNVRLQYSGPDDRSVENRRRTDNPAFQKGFNALASSINYIGGTIGNALEEGISIVENRTADIIQETRKHMKKKPVGSESQNQPQPQPQPQMQTDLELQLKASRDVAMAMAAKAKLLLRELKTVKADLAFAKERCAQLEEENKILRENREMGDNPEDDDLIRLQLETLLAEKARLAHENSVYARENRFLREVVEYHQLTMQDVVYLDEGSEEVTEVYPIKVIGSNPLPPPEVRGGP